MAVPGLSCPEKSVLLVLAIMANAAGEAWPSIAQIAERASIGRRTAFEALDRLAALGILTRATNPGKGTRYTLTLKGCATRTSAPPAPVRPAHSTGAPPAPKQPRTPNRKKASPSPLPRAVAPDPYPMPHGVDPQAWSDFLANRKRKRLPNTASAHKTLLDDLRRSATDDWPVPRLIAFAAGKGWASVRNPEKEDRYGTILRGGDTGRDSLRGSRPDPAFDLYLSAQAELAAERAAEDQGPDRQAWSTLPAPGSD